MTIDEGDMEVAERRARSDRETLARLVREGKVTRDDTVGANVAGAAEFVREIEGMVRPKVNLAIRPKKKRKR